ncbi:energy transducer TonB [Photobacterium damselae subsp. damselae]|uniref:energy transducer TonB n=1 Tax=Photobacterium damselae TaxID=38293 RepID=UPI00083B85C1|nr:energy transducer TonB [Photobacterium damselae]KAB1175584.1 energy transducer TonB [Photobacterium damselae subsp. damselae]MBF7098313.1 energy transducer TonB [Photobacterium damselae]QSH58989.1 energy transducer TonB [Photobacterium damselae subsp. damselae]
MLRVLMAFPLAILLAGGLFTFMAWMVDNGSRQEPESTPPLSFNIVMVEQESEVQRRQRVVPPKPEAPKPPPQVMPSQSKPTLVSTLPVASISALGLDTSISGIAVSAPKFGKIEGAANLGAGINVGSNQQAMPLYRVEPRYPARALKQGAEGYVVLQFTIDTQGRPSDISVVEAKPRRLFERDAMRALRKWKYQAKVIDGQAVEQPGQTVKLEFKINQ